MPETAESSNLGVDPRSLGRSRGITRGSPRSCTRPISATSASTPEAAGIDLTVRALALGRSDQELFEHTDALYDGLYRFLA